MQLKNSSTVRVGVLAASGRMGKSVLTHLHDNNKTKIAGAVVRNGSILIGKDCSTLISSDILGVAITNRIEDIVKDVDVIIDFSLPKVTINSLPILAKSRIPVVIGTTGFTQKELDIISSYSQEVSIVMSPNMSIGINICFMLLKQLSRVLAKDNYDIEIVEAHHRNKIDAPSGTALKMGEIIAEELGLDLNTNGVFARHGIIGKREDSTIGFSAIRGGDIIGEHNVIFANDGERIELTHKASNRLNFAKGAVKAAIWLTQEKKPAKIYSMFDVLKLKS